MAAAREMDVSPISSARIVGSSTRPAKAPCGVTSAQASALPCRTSTKRLEWVAPRTVDRAVFDWTTCGAAAAPLALRGA